MQQLHCALQQHGTCWCHPKTTPVPPRHCRRRPPAAAAATGGGRPPHQAPPPRSSARSLVLTAASLGDAVAGADAGEPQAHAHTRTALAVGCLAMAFAAVHRVAFAVLAVPIQSQLGFSLPQMGLLHSSLLCGYLLGQLPAGLLADRVGGAPLATVGLFLWSAICCLFSLVPSTTNPLLALFVVRAALGLAQSCIMPAASALAARWFPAASRSRYTGAMYSSYSVGTVGGLALAPLVAEHTGWGGTFAVFGAAGMAAAVLCGLSLPPDSWNMALMPIPSEQERNQDRIKCSKSRQAGERKQLVTAGVPVTDAQESSRGGPIRGEALSHLLVLCYAHSIISWSFFITQSWIPTILSSLPTLGLGSHLGAIGLLSALPWLATATVAIVAGSLADQLQVRWGWAPLRVRTTAHVLACVGTSLSVLPLALPWVQLAPGAAVAALTSAVTFQGLNYSGFHSYVQDVAPGDAGLVLAITNTCGTLVGIVGNLLTGFLAASAYGYTGIFIMTILLQSTSLAAWLVGAHGQRLQLR